MKVRPMLGEFELTGLEYVESAERRSLVEHAVPGLEGSYLQDLGSAPNTIVIGGSRHGDEARDKFLEGIRELFNAGEPTTFVADINAGTDLTQVVIENLEVVEMGGSRSGFRYRLVLKKYVEPPAPVAPPGLLNAGILEDALSLADAFDLIDQLGSVPNLGDPTPPVRDALGQVETATGGLDGVVRELESLFEPAAAGRDGAPGGVVASGLEGEVAPLPSPEDVELDPEDPRIDQGMNEILRSMLSDADGDRAGQAAGLVHGITHGDLAGITGDDSQEAGALAAAHGVEAGALVPEGQDAALVLDAREPLRGPSSVVVRSAAREDPARLTTALERAGRTFQLFRGGLLRPCASSAKAVPVANLVPPTFCQISPPAPDTTIGVDGQLQLPCPPIVDVEDVHFNLDRHVLMPEGPSPEPDGEEAAEGLRGLDAVAAALAHSRLHPTRRMLVAGHTDRTGSIRYNLRLSARRADNVFFVLQGHVHKAEWVKSAMIDGGHADDWRRILRWIHKRFGIGAPASDPRSPNAAVDFPAIRKFQEDYNAEVDRRAAAAGNPFAPGFTTKIPPGQKGFVGISTWQAFFDFYQRELVTLLGLDTTAELQAIQGGVSLVDPAPTQGCGEFHSRDPEERARRRAAGYPEEPGPREPANRRVEVLFFDPGEAPAFPCHPGNDIFECDPDQCLLYRDGDFARRRLLPAGESTPTSATIVGVDRLRKETITPNTRTFSPLLHERVRFRIRLDDLPVPFAGKVRLVLARPLNDGLGTVSSIEVPVCTVDRKRVDIAVEWDGTTDRVVPRQLSRRTTPDRNKGGAPTHLPLRELGDGDLARHGTYLVERLELVEPDGVAIFSETPDNSSVVVPVVCTLFFNLKLFVESLGNFGIGDGTLSADVPYLDVLRRAITTVMERYYEGIGVRFATTTRADRSVGIEVEFASVIGVFGEQFPGAHSINERGPGFDIKHNIFGWRETSFGHLIDVQAAQRFRAAVGPTSILARNLERDSDDSKAIHEFFGPLGVPRGSVFNPPTLPGTPAPRTIADGRVTGRVTPLDEANTTSSVQGDGVIRVQTRNPAVVPTRRADAIRKALNAFANAVGTIGAHELGHCLGLLQTADPAKARIELPGQGTFLSPLTADGDHNPSPRGDCLMDDGSMIRLRKIFEPGRRLDFRPTNRRYLEDCFPDRPVLSGISGRLALRVLVHESSAVAGVAGPPVPEADVKALGPSTGTGTTGPTGEALIPGLAPGTYQVAATKEGFEEAATQVVLADDLDDDLSFAEGGAPSEPKSVPLQLIPTGSKQPRIEAFLALDRTKQLRFVGPKTPIKWQDIQFQWKLAGEFVLNRLFLTVTHKATGTQFMRRKLRDRSGTPPKPLAPVDNERAGGLSPPVPFGVVDCELELVNLFDQSADKSSLQLTLRSEFRIRITDPAGAPAAGMSLRVIAPGSPHRGTPTTTDTNGEIVITDPAEGVWTLVSPPDHRLVPEGLAEEAFEPTALSAFPKDAGKPDTSDHHTLRRNVANAFVARRVHYLICPQCSVTYHVVEDAKAGSNRTCPNDSFNLTALQREVTINGSSFKTPASGQDISKPGARSRGIETEATAHGDVDVHWDESRFLSLSGNDYKLATPSGVSIDIIGKKSWGAAAIKTGPDRSWEFHEAAKGASPPYTRAVRKSENRRLHTIMRWITVHHTQDPAQSSPQTLRDLQKKHQDPPFNPFNPKDPRADIGYHYVVDADGKLYEGRPLGIEGSHAELFNAGNIGIVLAGEMNDANPTAAALATLDRLVDILTQRFDVNDIWSHQERNKQAGASQQTECPGSNLIPHVDALHKKFPGPPP